jgi:hypothetical protein
MPTVKDEYEIIHARLAAEAEKMPNFKAWMAAGDEPPYTNPLSFTDKFLEETRNILFLIGIREFYQDKLHEYFQFIKFKPKENRYFHPSDSLLRVPEVPADEDLSVIFGVGFDEGLEYENDAMPQIIIWYDNSSTGECTDFDPRGITEYDIVFSEFFDMAEFMRNASRITWPPERYVQKTIFETYS